MSEVARKELQLAFCPGCGTFLQKAAIAQSEQICPCCGIEPKKELVVPAEYVKQTLLRGSGFENGRTRICKIYETEIDAGTRARLVKKEYGQGGAVFKVYYCEKIK